MYNWIQSTFQVGEGLAQGLALVISLAVVLVLFGLFIFIIKRLMGANVPQSRGRQPRIAVMDSAAIDSRRRLLLVRRDNIEHLILVGGPSDVVVEHSIVRNAPLAAGQARSGTYQGAQQSGSIKAPLAPGPDIPLTPEDSAPAPQPLQATEVRAAPAPLKPAAASVANSTSPKVPPAPASPSATETMPGKSPAIGHAARPSLGTIPAPATKPDSPGDITKQPGGMLNALKEKTTPLTASSISTQKPPVAETSPAQTTAPKNNAPAVNIGQSAKPAVPKDNSLRSLARPFSPKDRPSYGSGKISPPASGPAARVRTALINPVETDTQTSRVEPMLGKSGETVPTTANVLPEAKIPARTDDRADAPEVPSPAPVSAEVPDSKATAQKADLSETVVEGIEKELFADPKPDTADEKTETGDTSQPDEEKPAETVAAVPETAQTESEEKTSPDTSASDEAKNGDDRKPVGSAASPSHDKGLGDRNPIEAEMAKILDELGGQPKQ